METMASAAFAAESTVVLRRAALRAIRAPSIHNTQPWTFVVAGDRLDIHVDPDRALDVVDPRGRQLVISCGCALLNARVGVAAAGYEPVVDRFPRSDSPNLVARVGVGARAEISPHAAALDRAIDRRRTNRRAFIGDPVSTATVAGLAAIARDEDASLVPISAPEHRALVTELLAEAARLENEDPAYRDELLAWTTDDPRRVDGVQAATIPYAVPSAPTRNASAVRAFDLRGMGWLPPVRRAAADECLLALCTAEDDPPSWLRAGEALERVWLELTELGLWASPIGQLVEVRGTHDRLREGLGLVGHPQLLLRVGRGPETPATGRRPASDVIVDV